MAKTTDLMVAEFQGTYRVAHPQGLRDQTILKSFRVKVKMNKSFLQAPGLQGVFHTYYSEFLKKLYPGMIAIYKAYLVEARNLDGSKIQSPKAMSQADLAAYIAEKQYPINTALYSAHELRNEVVLYETDPEGQQKLQGGIERVRGGLLEHTAELSQLEDLIVRLDESDSDAEALPTLELATAGKGKGKTKAAKEADVMELPIG